MIYTVTLNPALDKSLEVPNLTLDEVNRVSAQRTDPGGKGINVSKVIAALGGESRALMLLGGHTGDRIAGALEKAGIECLVTPVPGETRTNLKLVDPIRGTHTDVNEPGPQVSQELLDALLGLLLERLMPGDMVALSGSLPRGAAPDTYYHWTLRCQAAGAKVFLDADGEPLARALEAKPYLVKPNRAELSRLLGRPLDTQVALTLAARELLALGIKKVVISLGGDGALYAGETVILHAPALPVTVAGTVGAGDSMVAALLLAEEGQLSPAEALRFAVATSAAKVQYPGSQPPTREAVEALLAQT